MEKIWRIWRVLFCVCLYRDVRRSAEDPAGDSAQGHQWLLHKRQRAGDTPRRWSHSDPDHTHTVTGLRWVRDHYTDAVQHYAEKCLAMPHWSKQSNITVAQMRSNCEEHLPEGAWESWRGGGGEEETWGERHRWHTDCDTLLMDTIMSNLLAEGVTCFVQEKQRQETLVVFVTQAVLYLRNVSLTQPYPNWRSPPVNAPSCGLTW